jgi:alpha-L-fucosidase
MAETNQLKGAELASRLKSTIKFKSSDGVQAKELQRLDDGEMRWWQDAKFGLFIHWGLYSLLGRGEWVMFNESIPAKEYARLADQFNPRCFNAEEWAQIAKNAGMKYSVMVTRHHDGFALWDSPGSHAGFTSVRHAAQRDFIAEYTQTFRNAGFRTGLYYSPMDWRFPGYFQPRELPDSAAQMKTQCYAQVEELMSRYGKLDILWYDGAWLAHKGTDAQAAWLWDPVRLNQMARHYQPGLVINERSGWEGDIETDEGSHALHGPIMPIRWEKCFTLLNGWGYNADGYVMPCEEVLSLLVNTWIRGGNVLLNVGPDADGAIPPEQAAVLGQIGEFMKKNGESIYATRPGPFQPVDGVYGSTYRGTMAYLHILDCDAFAQQSLPLLSQRVLACISMDNRPIPFLQDENGIRFHLPEGCRQPVDTIVRLIFNDEVAAG